ncbi:MAG: multidrug ABC transporter ATP-binding protein [Bacteroidetes bacterium GWF2_41_61]|jgi:ABC-2 type transport system ATP-binding protein|nr:MAG: multidrug ABC transporter ATP-binding protein [Bacteroidetes bacterium GWE2_40_15]OFY26907.1 MAG: multidrug ABC transporter ATP-binding protein [Bacteroidetes bacterium GWF2_41_61]OFY90141.1 MAG: multidrug ABC transporter ATP-binding protein [Bacteroidetes bacterium RIFOXYA12_FULL_40_10]PKP05558.1 MAG: multidrug ABC transporter ATP-binding protein [Bacteroidetes bacterium HGW-Bacteroidetes-5]HBG24800.1 multidrug ABC transporter ATP-binding protein [Rikenellaceae bacterium]
MTEPIVRVENLSHRYSVQWAVKNVDFEIADCGIYGLLGSNGAGKSTIMNIICGVLKQTNGNVFINGIDMRSNSIEAKKHIGFLPQKPPLHPDLTVEEYLTHCANLRMIPEKEIKSALDSVLGKCAITHFRKRLIKNLSGGYQQRVGIAQAIIHNPNLVVLDEPTNGLDPNQTVEIRNLIKEIARERTVLLSTHILSEVQATCDYIRMVEEGKVVFAGTVDEFDNYIEPNTVFVSLLESPPAEDLKALPGVLDVEELGDTRYRVKFSDTVDIIERIVEASVSKGWRLNEIRLERSSLDTIFAELSKTVK